MTISDKASATSAQTIAAYEDYAEQYSRNVAHVPSANDEAALRRIATAAGPGGRILEIGSGPGWEADFIEPWVFRFGVPTQPSGSWKYSRRAANPPIS